MFRPRSHGVQKALGCVHPRLKLKRERLIYQHPSMETGGQRLPREAETAKACETPVSVGELASTPQQAL